MLRDYIEYLGKRKRIESDVESTKLYEERCFKTTKLGSFAADSFIIGGFLRKVFFLQEHSACGPITCYPGGNTEVIHTSCFSNTRT